MSPLPERKGGVRKVGPSHPDLADPDLMAGLKRDILQKTRGAKRKTARTAWLAAAMVAAFAAANIWLGPLWQRPALVAAAVSPGNDLELTFNQPMNAASWPENGLSAGAVAPSETAPTAKSTMALPQESAPRTNESSAARRTPTFGPAHATEAPPAYTVTSRGKTIFIALAGPRPRGPVRILVPATVRDLWGRKLDREYLVVVEHGKVTVTAP